MSCSDKIAKWAVVGVQGSLLSHIMDAIILSTIVVSADTSGSLLVSPALRGASTRRLMPVYITSVGEKASQLEALERAILVRTNMIRAESSVPVLLISNISYEHGKCNVEAMCASHRDGGLEGNTPTGKRKRNESIAPPNPSTSTSSPSASATDMHDSAAETPKTSKNKMRPCGTSINWITSFGITSSISGCSPVGTERIQAQG